MRRFKIFILSLLASFTPLFGTVNHSILPLMNTPFLKDLSGKINESQKEAIENALCSSKPLRVMSFNMLFNLPISEEKLDSVNRWPARGSRLIEYLAWACPDLIGTQELQRDQIQEINRELHETYGYYGMGTGCWGERGDVPTVFYKKSRLELLEGNTHYFSDSFEKPIFGASAYHNTFIVCRFWDICEEREFYLINTHLAFSNIEKRYYEATLLRNFINRLPAHIPIIMTGDFNTFPFRQELGLPFYDGEEILSILESSCVKDSQKLALLGHFGPISSTNYCLERNKPFCVKGTPGVILDHIFVNPFIRVLRHGIDPAEVDGYFPSDHFPVIADLQFLQGAAESSTMQ